jgi:hypothetical protein
MNERKLFLKWAAEGNWKPTESMWAAWQASSDMLRATLPEAPQPATAPIDMLLWCPQCGEQHIDAPDERAPDWTNPPHKSHLCHGCSHIWRPADVPTNGVQSIKTKGQKDCNPRPRYFTTAADFEKAELLTEMCGWLERLMKDESIEQVSVLIERTRALLALSETAPSGTAKVPEGMVLVPQDHPFGKAYLALIDAEASEKELLASIAP